MKDTYLLRLQRMADAAARAHKRARAAGLTGARANEDHEALLWAITTIIANGVLIEHETKAADELLRLMGLDPAKYRTDGGFLNVGKIRAAWRGKVLALRTNSAVLISASSGRRQAGRSVSAFVADQLAPFPDPVPPAEEHPPALRAALNARAELLRMNPAGEEVLKTEAEVIAEFYAARPLVFAAMGLGRSATRHPLAAEADRLESLGG